MEKYSTRLAGLAAPAQAGGVDQRVAPPGALERHLDRVARGARLVEGDDALLADQRVDQRRLADVRPADDGDARMAVLVLLVRLLASGKCCEHQVDQLAQRPRRAPPRSAHGSPRPSSWNSATAVSDCMPSVLLTARCSRRLQSCAGCRRSRGRPGVRPARPSTTKITASDSAIACSAWRAISTKTPSAAGLEAAGVDDEVRPAAQAAVAVVAVARHARQVVHDRVAAAREAVEEGRLADVRPPDQGDDRLHGERAYRSPSCVCTSSPARAAATGAARTAPPPVAIARRRKRPNRATGSARSPRSRRPRPRRRRRRGSDSWRLASFSCFHTGRAVAAVERVHRAALVGDEGVARIEAHPGDRRQLARPELAGRSPRRSRRRAPGRRRRRPRAPAAPGRRPRR